MTTTAKLFTLGKAQAVRIPARYRLQADEVEITEQDGALILRPRPRTAADVFARARATTPSRHFSACSSAPPMSR